MKRIEELEKSELEYGANCTLVNAKGLFKVAHQAAAIGQYGAANSMLITSVEELAKASMLQIISINSNVKIQNIEAYFWKHSVKHDSIIKLTIASLDLFGTDEVDDSDIPKKELSEKESIAGNLFIAIISLIVLFSPYQKKKKTDKEESLEDIRKAGLYVGFNRETGSWEVPNQEKSEENYETNKGLVDLAFSSIEESLFNGKMDERKILEFVKKLEDKNVITDHIK